ncbi:MULTISPECIES: helix-turn-helix domain-containing protein [unclassified Halomonas]|jgi:DNA-binding MarR family transcriptional regulator|uniref:helix-turn-helix domain-containing protein n=1 Tax=unclassified Halomonas TaxID=2609666 RepID=UPI00403320BE|tara:strand:- start:787 stop:1305 length:519 start_codon:yes stop_codon:yes gene_type:complete
MHHTTVATEAQRRERQLEFEIQDQKEAKEREDARKNRGFTQIYPKGWERLTKLAETAPTAFKLYSFLAQHIDPTCGAVVCDQKFLADQFGVSTRTIRNWITKLEGQNAIVRIPVAGRVCAYALDPHEVWKGYDNAKGYAAFVSKTLVNQDGDIKRRIMSMFSPDERPKEPVE